MAVLKIRPRDPSSARFARVSVELCDADGNHVDGHFEDGEVVKPLSTTTDTDGVLDLDLVPNDEIQPTPTAYRVTIDRRPFIIVKTGATQTLFDALATGLGPLSPVVGARNIDGGHPDSTYGATVPIDGGTP